MWIVYAKEHHGKASGSGQNPLSTKVRSSCRTVILYVILLQQMGSQERWAMWRDSTTWVAISENVSQFARDLATLASEKKRWIEEDVARIPVRSRLLVL